MTGGPALKKAPPRWPGAFLVAAPLSMILALLISQDVVVAFLVYHVGMCLVVPVLHSMFVYRDTFREALYDFTLLPPSSPRGWWMGAGVGLAM
ncbi:MAG: hypothetical protein R3185_08400, partial [Candidatus Thermoplasmatota archaeon]|nr:hypothetical protein [Candidatus Thermoplasmatota archaeon]